MWVEVISFVKRNSTPGTKSIGLVYLDFSKWLLYISKFATMTACVSPSEGKERF